ncbi:MAG TPA: MBL fold metallo-hydrolase [Gemmatimonadaceae bacterium]|nr:MBL fold metallo-hydrolase [Gemmatimonadaceae bacterium]
MSFRLIIPVVMFVAGASDTSIPVAWPRFAPRTVDDSVTLVTLGTGVPVPDPRAAGPATAVVVGSRVFLFDAGSGVERQLNAAKLPIDGVEAVFFTHLHSDHVLGYPDLIFTSWVFGRRTPLRAFGPPGLKAMTDHLIAAFAEDISVRTTGPERAIPGGYRVNVKEVRSGIVYDSAGVRVRAFMVPHSNWKVALGYRIEARGKSIVISGDTRPSEAISRAAEGADILVHEVYAAAKVEPEKMPGGSDWPRYLASAHTSDVEIGAIAARAKPKMVVLTHIVRLGATDGEMIAAVKSKGYTGKVAVAHDLDRF